MDKNKERAIQKLAEISPVVKNCFQFPDSQDLKQNKWVIYDESPKSKRIFKLLCQLKPFVGHLLKNQDLLNGILSEHGRQNLKSLISQMQNSGLGKKGIIISSESVYANVADYSLRHRETNTQPDLSCVLSSVSDDFLQALVNHKGLWNPHELSRLKAASYKEGVYHHLELKPFKEIIFYAGDLKSLIYAVYAAKKIERKFGFSPFVGMVCRTEYYNRGNLIDCETEEKIISNLDCRIEMEYDWTGCFGIPSPSETLFIIPQYIYLNMADMGKQASFYVVPKAETMVINENTALYFMHKSIDVLEKKGANRFVTELWRRTVMAPPVLNTVVAPRQIEKEISEHKAKLCQLFG